MSRQVKNTQTTVLTKLPPKPSQQDYYDEVGEVTESPKCQTYQRDSTMDTDLSSEPDYEYRPTMVQLGASIRAELLLQHLFFSTEGFSSKSAPQTQETQISSVQGFSSQRLVAISTRGSRETGQSGRSKSTFLRALFSKNPNAMSIEDYLHRFFEYGSFEDSVVIAAMIYLERALKSGLEIRANHFHKLFCGCLLLAHKFLTETTYWGFVDFGFLGGVTAAKLKDIESCILFDILACQLFISDQEFARMEETLLGGFSF